MSTDYSRGSHKGSLTSEKPLIDGGVKHATHRIIIYDQNIAFIPRVMPQIVYYLSFFSGIGAVGYEILNILSQNSEDSLAIIFIALCFASLGLVGLYTTSSLDISKAKNTLVQKKNLFYLYKETKILEYGKPVAIQLIKKSVSAKRDTIPFLSVELNLVYNTGKRINLLQDGNQTRIENIAKKVCKHLNLKLSVIDEIFDT